MCGWATHGSTARGPSTRGRAGVSTAASELAPVAFSSDGDAIHRAVAAWMNDGEAGDRPQGVNRQSEPASRAVLSFQHEQTPGGARHQAPCSRCWGPHRAAPRAVGPRCGPPAGRPRQPRSGRPLPRSPSRQVAAAGEDSGWTRTPRGRRHRRRASRSARQPDLVAILTADGREAINRGARDQNGPAHPHRRQADSGRRWPARRWPVRRWRTSRCPRSPPPPSPAGKQILRSSRHHLPDVYIQRCHYSTGQ